MKRIFTIVMLLMITSGANAQDRSYQISDKNTFEEFVRNIVILLMIYLVTSFILKMIKQFLDDRLKRKIVESGTPEGVVAQLLLNDKSERKNSLKWFCTLTAMTVGLGIIGYYHPSEIYALMVMAFSLALGFLSYFFLVNRLPK